MGIKRARAIVINSRNLAESDRIITFFSREFGKFKGVAKGVRKIKSRFGSSFEIFTHGNLIYYEKENTELVRITGFDLINSFRNIRSNLAILTQGAWILEIVDRCVMERDQNPHLFNLLLQSLRELNKKNHNIYVGIYFGIHALRILGYKPALDFCIKCKNPLAKDEIYFDSVSEGLICSNCIINSENKKRITMGAINTIKRIDRLEFAELNRIRMTNQIEYEIIETIKSYFSSIIGYESKSLRFQSQIFPH